MSPGHPAAGRQLLHICITFIVGVGIGTGGWLAGRIVNLAANLSIGVAALALGLILYGGTCADAWLDVKTGMKIARILAVLWILWLVAGIVVGTGAG